MKNVYTIFTCFLVAMLFSSEVSAQELKAYEKKYAHLIESTKRNLYGTVLRHKEVNDAGLTLRHVVKTKIFILTRSATAEQRKNHKGLVSFYRPNEVAIVKRILDEKFNGPENHGFLNLKGERVFFEFDVQEKSLILEGLTSLNDIRELAKKEAEISGEKLYIGESETSRYRKVLPNYFLKWPLPGLKGTNDGIITIVDLDASRDPECYLHEMLHQMLNLTSEEEHLLGGGLADPPRALSSLNIQAVLDNAVWANEPIRVVNEEDLPGYKSYLAQSGAEE